MPSDPFQYSADSPVAPAAQCFTITPHDSEVLPFVTKAIYVGQGGDITLRSLNASEDVVFRNIPDGGVIDVRVQAVRLTGTTATDLVGLA